MEEPGIEGGERAKILDFGIAKFLAESGGKQTTVGLILGTPKYMSPEQCEGRESLTDKVDVYALGAIFYEMLAGAPLFDAISSAALMRQHMMREPQPLPDKGQPIPADLKSLVHAMLAKAPEARPSMAQVLSDLRRIKEQPATDGVKVAAGKPDTLPKARRPGLSRPLLIGFLFFVVSGSGAGILIAKLRPGSRSPAMDGALAKPLPAAPEPKSETPGSEPHAATHDGAGRPLEDPTQRADKARRHKASRLPIKEAHVSPEGLPHGASSTPSMGAAEADSGKSRKAVETPKRSKVTNVEIEPDR